MKAATLESTLFVVRRPFDGAGLSRERGEVVDTVDWLHVRGLVSGRYLEALPHRSSPVSCTCGRSWIDTDARAAHGCAGAKKASGGSVAAPKPRTATRVAPRPRGSRTRSTKE